GDTGRVPYGSRSPETIVQYARQDENFLLSQDVKMIIAACGTVSAVAGHTSEELPVPFIGVVDPAARAAVAASRTGRIGVIGTSATIASGSYTRHILALRPGARVFTNDCPLFVPLVEAGWIDDGDPVTVETARRYLEPLIEARVDALILGCTHYPVLTRIIGRIMGEGVSLINTGRTAAQAAAAYLREHGMLSGAAAARPCRYYVSDHTESFSQIASILLGREIGDQVERVDITRY
ncbi:MAG: glutamate racemase, partial [Clostridiales bacterium]|nr:glutamate racemase [Clostridiales bacterium]